VSDRLTRFFPQVAIAICCLFAVYVAVFRSGYFSSSDDLASLLFLQVLLGAIWNYRTRFFPLLLAAFLWAGMTLPLNGTWTSGRWVVLAVGALAGLVVYARDQRQRHSFATFHLVALFCVVAALVSAAVSAYPSLAFLKAMGLLLLFLYGSFGARVAVMGRAASFFLRLLLGCELLVYTIAISYFMFHAEIFGNPNSLGAVMGVAAVPVLLWGVMVSERPTTRWRRTFAFALALLLLFSSYARAGIAGAAVSCILLCIGLRRYGLLLKGLGVALGLAALVAAVVPFHKQPSQSLTSVFVYKGHREDGILASRRPIWDETVSTIQAHPWWGSGFGTSPTSSEVLQRPESFESLRETTREHGNSYLAITEWVGFVGDIPFLGLVVLVAVNVGRALAQMRRTGNVLSPAIPLAGVLAAGLVHAAFEDWLFAPGYYLCVFFWSLAFIMVDVLPVPVSQAAPTAQSVRRDWTHGFGAATLGR
jgi:O-antigen ligase